MQKELVGIYSMYLLVKNGWDKNLESKFYNQGEVDLLIGENELYKINNENKKAVFKEDKCIFDVTLDLNDLEGAEVLSDFVACVFLNSDEEIKKFKEEHPNLTFYECMGE